jgi:hypothetical protein
LNLLNKKAVIIQGAVDVFLREAPEVASQLANRGFQVTHLHQYSSDVHPNGLTKNYVLENLLNAVRALGPGDSLLVGLYCHGTSVGAPAAVPSLDSAARHSCCLNIGCTQYFSAAELYDVLEHKNPQAKVAVIDRSCYGGATVSYFGFRGDRNTCVVSTATDTSVGYDYIGSLSTFLERVGPTSISLNHYLDYSRHDLDRRMPRAPFLGVSSTDCAAVSSIRRELTVLGLPHFPEDADPSERRTQVIRTIFSTASQSVRPFELIAAFWSSSPNPFLTQGSAMDLFFLDRRLTALNAALDGFNRQHGSQSTTSRTLPNIQIKATRAITLRLELEVLAHEIENHRANLVRFTEITNSPDVRQRALMSTRGPADREHIILGRYQQLLRDAVAVYTEKLSQLHATTRSLQQLLGELETTTCSNTQGPCSQFEL